jgi:murein L,D-transpeptidase YcbB/YkuD
MKPILCVAFVALIAAQAALPAYGAEPDAPVTLIAPADAVRIAVQERLAAKFTGASPARIEHQGALVEYYAAPENKLLWVDQSGLTDRGNAVIEEIAKAGDYGLRAADYPLPKSEEATADPSWLADAEIKISFAVLAYTRDARGGRITPSRLTPNLDPDLILPDPLQVIETISFRSDPASYLRSFHPDLPQFEALRQALIAARGGKSEDHALRIPDGPILKPGMEHEQVALLRERLQIPASAASSFPTSTTCTCMTRRRDFCSQSRSEPRATAACACRTPISWRQPCSATIKDGMRARWLRQSRTATTCKSRCGRKSLSMSPTSRCG